MKVALRILFDHQTFVYQNFGGISRYFVELAKGLDKLASTQTHFSILLSDNAYLKELAHVKATSILKGKFPGRMTIYNAIDRIYSRRAIASANYDIFHATYYDDYFLDLPTCSPFVITVHDMIHELYPGLWGNQQEIVEQKKKVIFASAGIIAVSENTKKDLLRIYPSIAPNKVTVVHHGNSFPIKNAASALTTKREYLLYVGNRDHYKNFDRFLEAFKGVVAHRPSLHLICAGGGAFTDREMALLKSLDLLEQVSFEPIRNDEHLASLYQNALFFVYPSLYEGFGIPILEAFSCGCPVVLSSSSCFPEVAGDAALYFDGNSASSMQAVFEELLSNPNRGEQLRQLGFEKVKEYTWEKAAQKTHDFYCRILAE